MSKAMELITRAKQKFVERGYGIINVTKGGDYCKVNAEDWRTTKEYTIGHRHVYMYTTYRNNGTDENVTVTMEIIETMNANGVGRTIEKIKIPKDASERVLNSRIQKAIGLIN